MPFLEGGGGSGEEEEGEGGSCGIRGGRRGSAAGISREYGEGEFLKGFDGCGENCID